jgi:hypothetical protein
MAALGGVAKALGAATAAGTLYVGLGLPLPATVAYVDGKIAAVVAAVADVKQTVLEGQLRDIVSQRALLRNERAALDRTIDKAPDGSRFVLQRRLGEIDDSLTRLTREEEAVAGKIAEGRK